MMNCDALASSPGDLDSSADVSCCEFLEMMSKRPRYSPTLMCGADFDVFAPPADVRSRAPVRQTGAR